MYTSSLHREDLYLSPITTFNLQALNVECKWFFVVAYRVSLLLLSNKSFGSRFRQNERVFDFLDKNSELLKSRTWNELYV